MRKSGGTLKLLLAFAAIYFLWGSTFLAIRFAVESLPPLLMMGTRHLVAGGALYFLMRRKGTPRPTRSEWFSALVAGMFLFLGCHGLLAWAEQRVPSGMAALLSATVSLWMVLLAWVWRQERAISARVLAGIALGLAGVAVLVGVGVHGTSWQTDPISALAVIAGEFCWAIGAIYARSSRRTAAIVIFSAMQMLCGGALLWIVGLAFGEGRMLHAASFQPRAVLSLAYMIVFGSGVAFTAYNWLLRVSSAAKVSTHAYVNPVVAVLLGWLLAGERITGRTIAGAAIVLASVALVSTHRAATAEEPEIEPEAASAD